MIFKKRRCFMEEARKEMLTGDTEKTWDILEEGVDHYAKAIIGRIKVFPEADVAFVIFAFESVAESLRKAYPATEDMLNTLHRKIRAEVKAECQKK